MVRTDCHDVLRYVLLWITAMIQGKRNIAVIVFKAVGRVSKSTLISFLNLNRDAATARFKALASAFHGHKLHCHKLHCARHGLNTSHWATSLHIARPATNAFSSLRSLHM